MEKADFEIPTEKQIRKYSDDERLEMAPTLSRTLSRQRTDLSYSSPIKNKTDKKVLSNKKNNKDDSSPIRKSPTKKHNKIKSCATFSSAKKHNPAIKLKKIVSFKKDFVEVIEVPSFKEYNMEANDHNGKKEISCNCFVY